MGFGLAAAILIDATIVRAVLLPAVMKLLGDWNWYLPRWLEWLPHIGGETARRPARAGPSGTPARPRWGSTDVSRGKGAPMKVEHRSPDERVRAKRRVLVVDDHAGFRSCASELLQAEGFEVVGEAEDGASALARAAELRAGARPARHPASGHRRLRGRRAAARRDPELAIVLVSSRDRSSYGPLVETSGAAASSRSRSSPGSRSRAARVSDTRRHPPATTRGPPRERLAPALADRGRAAATGAAVYLIAVSRIAPHPVAQSILTALVCFTFVGAGVARAPAPRRTPASACCSRPSVSRR